MLIVTAAASYQWLGFLRANVIAVDGQWTALFAANLHFAIEGTQYLNTFAPPSPLQHYWSLAVEEQFYLVWPLLLLIVSRVGRRETMRARISVVLAAIVGLSFAWSVVQTSQDANTAFFSPLTRAWELAIGALLAVNVPLLLRLPARLGPWLSWIGLAGIVVSAFLLNGDTSFPGYAAALPVLGAALAVAGGTVKPGGGAEIFLKTTPFQWLGKLSYSLYLWHWPLLIIPVQATGSALTLPQSFGLVALALALSVITYFAAENPIRRSPRLNRNAIASLALGLALVATSYLVCTQEIQAHRTRPTAEVTRTGE